MQRLKKEKELSQQETAHLKLQVDELSRLQHPREFRLAPPTSIPLDNKVMTEAGEMGVKNSGIGWNLLDRNVHLDAAIERAIGRWKGIVREARGAGPGSAGMAAQRSLSEGSTSSAMAASLNQERTPMQTQHSHQVSPHKATPSNSNANSNSNSSLHMMRSAMANGADAMASDQDADADADADMEEDDSFVEMADAPLRAPEASMAPTANFRLTNGHEQGRAVMDGLENQACVGGYVRIGA